MGCLEVGKIRVAKIRISGGWGDLNEENHDFWRFGKSVKAKSSFLVVGEIRVGKIKEKLGFLEAGEIRLQKLRISGGWGDPGKENQAFWRLGDQGEENQDFWKLGRSGY